MSTFISQHYTGRQVVRRLLREHILPYRGHLLRAVICMILVAAATAANAWLMQPALDQIFIQKNRAMLAVIPIAVFTVAMIGAAANYGNILNMRYVGVRIVADMQTRLFEHLMKSDLGLFHEQSSGRLISRFTNDINLLRNAFSNILTAYAKEGISMIFLIGVMVWQNYELALIAFGAFFFAIYPIIRLSKRMRRVSDATQNQMGEFTSTLDEIFSGVRTVKSYNREGFEAGRARSAIETLFSLYHKAIRIQAASTPIVEILSGVSIALVIWYGGYQVMDGKTTPGAFFSFIAAFLMAYKPVRALAGTGGTFQDGIAAGARLFAVLDTPPTIVDKPGAAPLDVSQGAIRYERVTFRYVEGGSRRRPCELRGARRKNHGVGRPLRRRQVDADEFAPAFL